MVLERLINPKKVYGHPWEMLLIGLFYSVIGAFLALWIFKNYVGVVMITFTAIASIPFVSSVIKQEEAKDMSMDGERRLLKEHGKAIMTLTYLFLGFTIGFILVYVFMPADVVQNMFNIQLNTISVVQSGTPTGNFASSFGMYGEIIGNNMKILLFCVAFSFFYGAGAIFILGWNASVMAVAIGAFIRNNMFNVNSVIDYFQVTGLGLAKYMLHGIPEIVAYFIAALAGGIVSFTLVKHDYMNDKFKKVLKDVAVLIIISVAIVLLSGVIEVYVTPLVA